MKLSFKLGGLCASGAFLVTATPIFFKYVMPLSFLPDVTDTLHSLDVFEALGISLLGSALIGAIGYIIGDILGNPQGEKKAAPSSSHAPSKANTPNSPVTGNEIFLSDAGLDEPIGIPEGLSNVEESSASAVSPESP